MILKPHSYTRPLIKYLMPLLKANGIPLCQVCRDLFSRLCPLTLHTLGPGASRCLHPARRSQHDPIPPSSLPGMFFLLSPIFKTLRGPPYTHCTLAPTTTKPPSLLTPSPKLPKHSESAGARVRQPRALISHSNAHTFCCVITGCHVASTQTCSTLTNAPPG